MPPRRPGRSQGGYLSPAPPRILAHRGFARDAPENTLPAFAAALEIGADYLETDVRASADGVAVLSHDADLFRLTGRRVPVRALTAAQLRRVDLGGGQGFTTLAEALDAFGGARFNIDVKAAEAVAPTVAAIRAAAADDRVLVTSFSDARRRALVGQLPGVASSASFRMAALALSAAACGLPGVLSRLLRTVDALQIPEVRGGIRLVTAGSVRRLQAAGVEVHVWTVNAEADMRRLLALGVDGLVTDRADLALRIVRGAE